MKKIGGILLDNGFIMLSWNFVYSKFKEGVINEKVSSKVFVYTVWSGRPLRRDVLQKSRFPSTGGAPVCGGYRGTYRFARGS
jgi:hypothetical protein